MENVERPKDAATVILTRDAGMPQFEIYLMRRNRQSNFMGGAYVFPGGRLDDEDCQSKLCALIGAKSKMKCLSPSNAKLSFHEKDIGEEKAIGLYFCAVRETFEEAGVLLAYDSEGRVITFSGGNTDSGTRFAEYRVKIHSKTLSLAELAAKENLKFAMDLLVPYSHWITPEIEKRRFDTRFFLARLPEGQIPAHDDLELIESLWICPDKALAQHKSGKMLLMPPTLKIIEELRAFKTVDQLFEFAFNKNIHTILPQFFNTENGFEIRLPHDPGYTIDPYKQPQKPDEPSRIIMQDGIWKLAFAE